MSAFAVSKYDIKHLRVFTAVVEHEGVTAAAHRAGVDLSTVSRDLSALEARLGVKLCRRGRGGFALTPQGESIYRASVELLSRLQIFEQEVRAAQETIGDKINFGVIDNVITNHGTGVVATLSKMHRDYPETMINVSVHEVSSIDVLVRERRIDIGMTGQPAWLQPLHYTPAFFEEDRLYVSRTSPHFDQIIGAFSNHSASPPEPVPYIARSYRTDVFQEFEQRHPLKVASMGSSLESILAAVLAGVGCALLPIHFVRGERCEDLVEIPFAGPAVSVQLYLVSRRDALAQPAVRAFMSCFNHVLSLNRAIR
jgi:DNA-binding transcriptional LysR family regulator